MKRSLGSSGIEVSETFQEQWLSPTLEKLGALCQILTSGGRTLAQGALA